MTSSTHRYALVIGNGRSGTNWLLSMLDASPLTFCRNEPQEIARSPYHQLPDPPLSGETSDLMANRWDAFVDWTASRIGERDHQPSVSKDYLYAWAQQTGLAGLPLRPKVQTALRPLVPALQQGEWRLPWWIGRQSQLEQAYAILKINDLKAWTAQWLFAHRRDVPILHIVRHPGGQLNSGIKRFFSDLTPAELDSEHRLYTGILRTAAALSPDWKAQFGDIDAMGLIEAVAWFWRYNNEEIYKAGQQADNYLCIRYEQLVQQPIESAQQVYALCGIPWTPEVEQQIKAGLGESVWGTLSKPPTAVANAWKSKLSAEHQTLANQVLQGSLMESWWTEEGLSA